MAIDINPRSGGATGVRPLPQFGRVLQTQSIGVGGLQGAAGTPREAPRSQLHVYGVVHAGEHQRQRQQLELPARPSPIRRTSTTTRVRTTATGATRSSRAARWCCRGTSCSARVFTARSTMPFSAIAGVDLNGDANITDYVPGTDAQRVQPRERRRTRWRRSTPTAPRANLAALSASQINTNEFYGVDIRGSKSIRDRPGPEDRTGRPGVQPVQPDEPAGRVADQRALEQFRHHRLGGQHAAGRTGSAVPVLKLQGLGLKEQT